MGEFEGVYHPWERHPSESLAEYAKRKAAFKAFGVWPKMGDPIPELPSKPIEPLVKEVRRRRPCDPVLLKSQEMQVKALRAEARALHARRQSRQADVPAMLKDGVAALHDLGLSDIEDAALPDIAMRVGRAALIIAAAKLGETSADRLLVIAQIGQRLSEHMAQAPSKAQKPMSEERAKKLLVIAQQLQRLNAGEDTDGESGDGDAPNDDA